MPARSRRGTESWWRIESRRALVREDDGVLYPVRDSIPIMLIDEAIPLGDVLKTT